MNNLNVKGRMLPETVVWTMTLDIFNFSSNSISSRESYVIAGVIFVAKSLVHKTLHFSEWTFSQAEQGACSF